MGARMSKTEKGRKKWVIFSVAALVCAAIVFIGGFCIIKHMRENYAQYTPNQITGQIIKEMKYSDLVKVDQSQVSKHYDVPDGVISDCSLYMSKSSESVSELSCFLLIDSSKFNMLKEAATLHLNSKATGFKSLNPTQYNTLKSGIIVQNGRYVLVAVGNNTAAEEKLFNSLLN